MDEGAIRRIERTIHYRFKDKSLLEQAFTHSSYANQNKASSNERLEFLGDSILDFVIAEALYEKYPAKEGTLSKWRANLVNSSNLSKVITSLKIEQFLRLGSSFHDQALPSSVKEDLFESIVGAIYLDSSMDKARRFILRFIDVEDMTSCKDNDYKTRLQELVQQFSGATLVYFTYEAPKKDNMFCAEIYINDMFVARSYAQNKKLAQIQCAKLVLNDKTRLNNVLKQKVEKEKVN